MSCKGKGGCGGCSKSAAVEVGPPLQFSAPGEFDGVKDECSHDWEPPKGSRSPHPTCRRCYRIRSHELRDWEEQVLRSEIDRLNGELASLHDELVAAEEQSSLQRDRAKRAEMEAERLKSEKTTSGNGLHRPDEPTSCSDCGDMWDAAAWVACPRCQITDLRDAIDRLEETASSGLRLLGFVSRIDLDKGQVSVTFDASEAVLRRLAPLMLRGSAVEASFPIEGEKTDAK